MELVIFGMVVVFVVYLISQDGAVPAAKREKKRGDAVSGAGTALQEATVPSRADRVLKNLSNTVASINQQAAASHRKALMEAARKESKFGKSLRVRGKLIELGIDYAHERRLLSERLKDISAFLPTNHAALDLLARSRDARGQTGRSERTQTSFVDGWQDAPVNFKTFRSLCVPYLCHFTHISNLHSILQNGLLPVDISRLISVKRHINDQVRRDDRLKATSTSVAFPNSRMLWKYRREYGMNDYVVIALDPSLMWRKTCAFCEYNAADKRISGRKLEDLLGDEAFEKMFGHANFSVRPSNDQAEVLVFGEIEPKWILAIFSLNESLPQIIDGIENDAVVFGVEESRFIFGQESGSGNEFVVPEIIQEFQEKLSMAETRIEKEKLKIHKSTFRKYLDDYCKEVI